MYYRMRQSKYVRLYVGSYRYYTPTPVYRCSCRNKTIAKRAIMLSEQDRTYDSYIMLHMYVCKYIWRLQPTFCLSAWLTVRNEHLLTFYMYFNRQVINEMEGEKKKNRVRLNISTNYAQYVETMVGHVANVHTLQIAS